MWEMAAEHKINQARCKPTSRSNTMLALQRRASCGLLRAPDGLCQPYEGIRPKPIDSSETKNQGKQAPLMTPPPHLAAKG
mmetsp:Transcript_122515/g.392019  ORF Transcript_122515/g.392019 Transcript_122515/m.392019 type:complete len:80 (+) Transcript_122515:91-330(+)